MRMNISGNALSAQLWGQEYKKIAVPAAVSFLLAAALTDVRIGGTLSPFGVSLAAAVSPVSAALALLGAIAAAVIGQNAAECVAELTAMGIMVFYGYIFRRKTNKRLRALISGIVYFICAAASAASTDWVLFLAVFFRAAMCAVMTYCIGETADIVKNGLGNRSDDELLSRLISVSAVFMLIISALCAREIWIINPGRIAAGFAVMAAARKFGVRGGAAGGVLSAAAFLLASQNLGRSGSMLAFAGLASGCCQPKGKHSVNIAFICSAFALTAAAGMPSGTPEFIADMVIASAVYCLLPERIYLNALNGICVAKKDVSGNIRADKLSFAAEVLEEVGNDVEAASGYLLKTAAERNTEEFADAVKSRVCSRVCGKRKCSAACGGLSEDVRDNCFKAAQAIAEKTGAITGKELPAGFEGCTKKAQLADGCNYVVGMRKIQKRKDAYVRRFLESASEQLSASCGMMFAMADEFDGRLTEDFALSESAEKILVKCGIDVRSMSVSFDKEMNSFIEAFCCTKEKLPQTLLSSLTEQLSCLLGQELEEPSLTVCGELRQSEDNTLCRIRWRSEAEYAVDSSVISYAAESGICGDSHIRFEDGRGNFYMIIADGMGKGGRAAAESGMAVSLLKRLILAGIGRESAVKTLNVLMAAASSDEVFTTVDMLSINCYSGECALVKMGGAPTVVMTRDDEGKPQLSCYEECSAPVGIIGKLDVTEERFFIDDTSRVVMTTDGISRECSCFIDALLDNEKLTCEQLADKIIAVSDEYDEGENFRMRDDKTVAVIRLYRNLYNNVKE